MSLCIRTESNFDSLAFAIYSMFTVTAKLIDFMNQSLKLKANELLNLQFRDFIDQSTDIFGSLRILCDLCESSVAFGENQVA